MNYEIEQVGKAFRWVLMNGDQRVAEGARKFDNVKQAVADYDEFAKAARTAPLITKPADAKA